MFDISQESEDDALVTSLNTEGVVRSLTFLPDNKLAIILDHEEAMLWKTDDCEAYKTFSREDFTVAIKRKVTPWTYIGNNSRCILYRCLPKVTKICQKKPNDYVISEKQLGSNIWTRGLRVIHLFIR